MSDKPSNFLIEFLSLATGTEIPEIFAIWSGIGAISAALGRRVWLDMGPYQVFPNLYILLVAASGRFRKSSSLKLASDLLEDLPLSPNVIPEKITPEAFIDALQEGQANTPGFVGASGSTGFVFASEFSTFFNRKSYEAGLGALLTNIWDCPKTWSYRTKARGVEKLERPCVGLLGASTIDWLRDSIPPEAVGGGFTSRCIFVYAEKPPAPVARTIFSQEKLETRERLLRALEVLCTFNGAASLTEEAWKYYEEEYERWYSKSQLYETKSLSGYASRRNVHWLKLAIIFAAAEGTLLLEERHLKGSLRILEQAEVHLRIVMSLLTASDMGANIVRVEEIIKKSVSGVTKGQLVRAMQNTLSSRQLNEIIDTLVAGGHVQIHVSGKDTVYVFKGL